MNRAVEKGKRGERELCHQLADLTGWDVSRRLLSGRHDDQADITGLPSCVGQVKNYSDVLRGIREVLAELPAQQARAGATFGAGFVRRRGGEWIVVMNVEQFCCLLREATGP